MMRHLGSNPTLTHSLLANIQCPVRLCVGDRDTTVSVEETLAAYRHLPKGQLAVLPGTPHPWEKVDLPRFAAGLLTFMAQ
jgi:pimeloyl-ACP methyl ester carboxylesterase